MVTINDIAKRLDIAPSTVSKGLNDANDVSPELKQRIIDTAIEMGYVTKRMKKERKKKIAIFVKDMEYEEPNDYGFDIILGFKQSALREGWDVIVTRIGSVEQSKESYDRYMFRNHLYGGFFLGFSLGDPWITQLRRTTVPTVLLDSYMHNNPVVGYVGTDSYEGIDLAIQHLVNLGHTKIALFNGYQFSMSTEIRYRAYISSMQARHLTVDEDLITYGYYDNSSIEYHIRRLIDNGATAVICGNDMLAVGILKECDRMGISVPRDLSVVGYDNLPVSKQMSLTTVNLDRHSLGRCSYATLCWLISRLPVSKSLLRPELVHRTTTCKLETD
jgi:LacI family transcriptional regulator